MADYVYGRTDEFSELFGGWLLETAGLNILVDAGVGAGAEDLVRRLRERLAGRPLDYVLLTHIHMDHAGGLGKIFQAWPDARAVVHEKGRRHLADPERLWAGTREVMGELAEIYGRPSPLEPDRLIPHSEAALPGLTILETPGHAVHHLSFRLEDVWFVGEAAGCPYLWGERRYGRPATPPRYYPEAGLASLDRLLEEPDGPAYFGHCSARMPLKETLRLAQEQLLFWGEFLRGPEAAWLPDESRAKRTERLLERLFQTDPGLRPLASLSRNVQNLEKLFLRNSVTGFLENFEAAGEAGLGR